MRKSVRFNLPSSPSTESTTESSTISTISTKQERRIKSDLDSVSISTSISTSWLNKVKKLNSKLTNIVLGKPQFDIDNDNDSQYSSSNTTISSLSQSIQNEKEKENKKEEKEEKKQKRLEIVGGRLCTSVLRAVGITKYLHKNKGKYKWYRINRNGEMIRIEGVNNDIFHPSIDDIGNKITCQWIPFGAGYTTNNGYKTNNKPSNFAQIGPILMDGKLENRCNDIINNKNIEFRVNMPQISSFPQIITIYRNYVRISPTINGINTMLKQINDINNNNNIDLKQQQSFDIHLNSNMRILFDDNYSSQFSIVDDEGNEYAQIITKDHIQRQLIALLIRKNLKQFPKQLSPKNKYYWQFKVQQLTQKNIVLQQEMNQIRHKNESLMPIIETLNDNKNNKNKSKLLLLSATQRESKLYLQLKDSRQSINIFKHQISDLTADRELLKQNFVKISGHLKKSLKSLDWYKNTKNKMQQIIKNLQENNIQLTEKVNQYEITNRKINDENIMLNEKLKIMTKQKDEAFNILKSDFCAMNKNNNNVISNKHLLDKYGKNDLIEMIQDLQNDLSIEHNVVQQQLEMIENYTNQLQQLIIENAQIKDRFKYQSDTLSWEQTTHSNNIQQQALINQPIQLISNHGYQETKIYQEKPSISHESSPKSQITATPNSIQSKKSVESKISSEKSSIFMSLLKAPPKRPPNSLNKEMTEKTPKTQVRNKMIVSKPNVNEWNIDNVYQWAKTHQFIGITKIAQQLKQHEIDGIKLQKLDEITLHIFGVPSKYISRTFKIIKGLSY